MRPVSDSQSESFKNSADTAAVKSLFQTTNVVAEPPPTLSGFISRIAAMDADPDCDVVLSNELCVQHKPPVARISQFDTDSSSDANDHTECDPVNWHVQLRAHHMRKVRS